MRGRPGHGRCPAPAGIATPAPRAAPARRAPAEHDAVAGRESFHFRPDSLDDPGALVPEHDREPVPPAVLEQVQVGVAHAARLDADENVLRPGLGDLDLLDRRPPQLGDYDAAIHEESSARTLEPPLSASVRSVSAARFRKTASTPSWPPTASP